MWEWLGLGELLSVYECICVNWLCVLFFLYICVKDPLKQDGSSQEVYPSNKLT